MCGIAGAFGAGSEHFVPEMTEALRHRGPDARGTHSRPGAQVGATRLRIRDLEAGDQPMVSPETGAALVFNGEIYNYAALREQLESRGHRFYTHSDTEVVLRGFEEWGEGVCERLRGMYAFAVLDGSTAWLARDPLGIKPLHYAWLDGGRTLVFASELKSLLRHPEVGAELCDEALADLHVLYYVADSTVTLLRDVRSLAPGTGLRLECGAEHLRASARPFAFGAEVTGPRPGRGEGADEDIASVEARLHELLDAAVRSHQLSDVPLCLTLSGGLDSTLLALALAQQGAAQLESYAVGERADEPDLVQAEKMARALGVRHHTRLLGFDDYLSALAPSMLACESLVDCVPQYLLFEELGASYRVNLNGEGADEVFCGYPEHRYARRYVERLGEAPDSLRLSEAGEAARSEVRRNPGMDADAWMHDHLLRGQLAQRHLDPLDKISMASSVEVRVPFLDHDLVAAARALPIGSLLNRSLGTTKYVLRRVFARRWRKHEGAAELVDALVREKRGFPDARRDAASRLHRICHALYGAEHLSRHRYGAYVDSAVEALWIDLFEALFCQWRGALPADFALDDFIARRADTSVEAVRRVIGQSRDGPREQSRAPRRPPPLASSR